MISDAFLFILRLLLTAALCGFVWTLIKPRTRSMRVVRALVLVLCLLLALAAIRRVGI
jgi:hypothetical protein